MHPSLQDRYPLEARLEVLIVAYSVHLVTALLALPMLLWHISSTSIIDDYGMPRDWINPFYTTQFSAGRGVLWGFLFVVVPVDCAHALLALDHYHGRRYAYARHQESTVSSESTQSSASSPKVLPLPRHPENTYHPLLTHHIRPPHRALLLTLYNVVVIAFLACHITSFFYLLGANMAACGDYWTPYSEDFLDPLGTGLTVLERCRRINTDMYVSGGFDVTLCFVLLGMHVWHLGFRGWQVLVFGVEREVDGVVEGLDARGRKGRGVGEGDGYVANPGRSTAILFRNWRAYRRWEKATDENAARSKRQSVVENASWAEAFLECLIP